MYLIQLFDENCVSCCSGVTKVFVDDIEDFSQKYLSEETKNKDRVDRFLRSKAGEVVTDYYTDSPDLNIVRKVETQEIAAKSYISTDKTITLLNSYYCESIYHFKRLVFPTRYIKYEGKFCKLIKPYAIDCCHRNPFDDEKPWRRIYINGNKFWLYKEEKETPDRSESTDDYQEISLESFVWHIADVFENEEDMKADMETTWPTDR